MPLSILGPMVVIGIGGIAILLHLLDLSRPMYFADEAAARAAWQREFPDAPPYRVILCKTRLAALIETHEGHGIVWAFGADSTARFLAGARAERRPNGLRLRLPDFTAPRIFLALDPGETALWLDRLARADAPAPQELDSPHA